MPDRHEVVGLPDEAIRIVRWQRRFVVLALSIIALFTLTVAVLGLMSFLRVNEQGEDIKHLIAEAAEAGRERQAEQQADRERSAQAIAGALSHIEEIVTVATDRNDARAHERYLDLVARLDARCGPGTPPPVPRQPAPPRAASPAPTARPRPAPGPSPHSQSPAVRPAPPPPAPNVLEPVPGQEEERWGPNGEKGRGKGPPSHRGPNR